jgi:hypothetical protein
MFAIIHSVAVHRVHRVGMCASLLLGHVVLALLTGS